MEIWPLVTSYMRMSRRRSVDLPLPEGPTTAHELPAGILMDTPRKTTLSSAAQHKTHGADRWLQLLQAATLAHELPAGMLMHTPRKTRLSSAAQHKFHGADHWLLRLPQWHTSCPLVCYGHPSQDDPILCSPAQVSRGNFKIRCNSNKLPQRHKSCRAGCSWTPLVPCPLQQSATWEKSCLSKGHSSSAPHGGCCRLHTHIARRIQRAGEPFCQHGVSPCELAMLSPWPTPASAVSCGQRQSAAAAAHLHSRSARPAGPLPCPCSRCCCCCCCCHCCCWLLPRDGGWCLASDLLHCCAPHWRTAHERHSATEKCKALLLLLLLLRVPSLQL